MSELCYSVWSWDPSYSDGDSPTFLTAYDDHDRALAHANWLVGPETNCLRGEVRDTRINQIIYLIERPSENSYRIPASGRRARPSALAAS